MTDEDLQRLAEQKVRITYGGQTVTGKLIVGFAAQVRVQAPYAIEWYDLNPTLGTNEVRLAAIASAAAVESIELVNEPEETKAEIEDAAEDAQTPG
jgi:hypothetical protein